MNNEILFVSPTKLKKHPKLEKINPSDNQEVKYSRLKHSIKKYGVKEPIKVVKIDLENYIGNMLFDYFIVDGLGRHLIALSEKIEEVPIQIITPHEMDVIIESLVRNTRVLRTHFEIAVAAEYYLNHLGKSQGKKRKIDEENKELEKASQDRYELTCLELNLDFSGTTLRRLMKIYEKHQSGAHDGKDLFERLIKGESILKVYESIDENIRPEDNKPKKGRKTFEAGIELGEKWGYNKAIKELESSSEYKVGYEKGYQAALTKSKISDKEPTNKSLFDDLWDDKIDKLKGLRLRISTEDEQIIEEILKKY